MTEFVDQHLRAFAAGLTDNLSPEQLGGKPWKTFCAGLEGVVASCFTPKDTEKRKISRSEVFDLANNEQINTASVCAAVFAWGGMRMHAHKQLFRTGGDGWIKIADQMRAGQINRRCAYEKFRTLRINGKLKGLGPAFFTKLIYFLTRHKGSEIKQGFIMDQWAACSINLLTGRPVVHLNCTQVPSNKNSTPAYNYTVSDLNSGAHYEDFCQSVEALIKLHPQYTADAIDRAFLGSSELQGNSWRDHVQEHRGP